MGSEPLCRGWDLNLGPLEGQPVLLFAQSYCDMPAHIWEAFEFGKEWAASQSLMGNSCVRQSISQGPAPLPLAPKLTEICLH